MRSINSLLLVIVASLPAVAFAQQMGPVRPADARWEIPLESQRRGLEIARRQWEARYDAVPDTFDPKRTENLDDFQRWAEEVRGQREAINATLFVLNSKDIERLMSADDIAKFKAKLTEQLANRDGWLDKATNAYLDKLKRDEAARRLADSQPAWRAAGPPQPPRGPVIIKSPEYMVAVDGLSPLYSEWGSNLTSAGNIPLRPGMGMRSPTPAEFGGKALGKTVAILDIIQFGYSAGGWMGNEVIIKGQMAENYKREEEYKQAYGDYLKRAEAWNNWDPHSGRKEWEDARREEREWKERAAARQFRIFSSLMGGPRYSTYVPPRPPAPPPLPPARPVAEREDLRVPQQLMRMTSTINCHSAPKQDSGFKLSLSGFDGVGLEAPRRSSTNPQDLEALRKWLAQPAQTGGAGIRR